MPATAAPKAKGKTKRAAGGRPPYEPTERERLVVRNLAAQGNRFGDIAIALSISEPTLRKYYWTDIQAGIAMGRVMSSKRLSDAARKGNVTAMIWIEKTRFGITEPGALGKKEVLDERGRAPARTGSMWEGLLQ